MLSQSIGMRLLFGIVQKIGRGREVNASSDPAFKQMLMGVTPVLWQETPEWLKALIAFYIDKNDNEKVDKRLLGIPTEQFGFSTDVMGRFGPPSFEAASFNHRNETFLTIFNCLTSSTAMVS